MESWMTTAQMKIQKYQLTLCLQKLTCKDETFKNSGHDLIGRCNDQLLITSVLNMITEGNTCCIANTNKKCNASNCWQFVAISFWLYSRSTNIKCITINQFHNGRWCPWPRCPCCCSPRGSSHTPGSGPSPDQVIRKNQSMILNYLSYKFTPSLEVTSISYSYSYPYSMFLSLSSFSSSLQHLNGQLQMVFLNR